MLQYQIKLSLLCFFFILHVSKLQIRHFFQQKVLIFFLFLLKNICYGTHQKCITGALLMSTHYSAPARIRGQSGANEDTLYAVIQE